MVEKATLAQARNGEQMTIWPVNPSWLPNSCQVSQKLWRGAKPTMSGLDVLSAPHSIIYGGFKTIIDLEAWFDFNPLEWLAVKRAGMTYKSLPCSPWHPEIEDVAAFLKIVTDPAQQPVFVHCRRGIDRTGMMCAIYRIVVQGWTKNDAIAEMTQGGFGWNNDWPEIIPFIRGLDIEQLRSIR